MGLADRLGALMRRKGAPDDEEDEESSEIEIEDDAEPDGDDSPTGGEPAPGRLAWIRPVAIAAAAVAVVSVLSLAVWLLPGVDQRAGIPRVVMDVPAPAKVENLVAQEPARTTSAPAALTPAAPGSAPPERPAGPETAVASTLVSPASVVAFAQLPPKPPAKPLSEVPDPALVEQGPQGPLPRIDGKGRQPWRVYAAQAAAPQGWPRVGILIEGLGMSRIETEAAIDRLPAAVSLAFSPYAADLAAWTARARQNGHETFLGLPLEPDRFPVRDPGPLALMTAVAATENVKRLEAVLSRAPGYVGLTSYMGERFLAAGQQVRPLFQSLKARGLAFIDATPGSAAVVDKAGQEVRLPLARVRLRLDDTPSRVAVDLRLSELEAAARRDGKALGIAQPYPATMERIAHWMRGLEAKGIALVPATALLEEAKGP